MPRARINRWRSWFFHWSWSSIKSKRTSEHPLVISGYELMVLPIICCFFPYAITVTNCLPADLLSRCRFFNFRAVVATTKTYTAYHSMLKLSSCCVSNEPRPLDCKQSGDIKSTHVWQWQEWMRLFLSGFEEISKKASKQPVPHKNTLPDVLYTHISIHHTSNCSFLITKHGFDWRSLQTSLDRNSSSVSVAYGVMRR